MNTAALNGIALNGAPPAEAAPAPPRRFPTTFEVTVRDQSPDVDPSRTVVRER